MTVTLRPLERADGPYVLAWRNSPDVARWMYGDRTIGEADHARWLDAVLAARATSVPDRLYWIVALGGAPVGVANLARIDRANARAEWAYYLADPSVRGQGVGSAVEFAVLAHAFGPLALNKLWCEVLVENTAVIALHERFGFRREALLRAHVRKDGAWRDVVGLGLLAQDWAAIAQACADRLRARGFDPDSLALA